MVGHNIIVLLIHGFLLYIHAQADDHLRVVSVESEPYFYQSNGKWKGFLPDLFNLLGYNYSIYNSPDKQYGSLVNGTTWNGIMGELVNGNADIAGLLTATSTRSAYVDFTYPVRSIGPTIVMKRPTSVKPSLQDSLYKLFVPFEVSVWLMSILALLVTGTVLYIISHFNPYEWRRMAKAREATLREGESFTCLNSFWFVVSTLMWQGYVRSPRSIGARLLVLSWFGFSIIFIACYIANLTNYLRIGPEPFAIQGYSKIRSFRDLAKNEDIRVGVIRGGSTEMHFASSKTAVDEIIYNKILKENAEYPTVDRTLSGLIEYLRTRPFSDYSLILESDVAKYHVHQEPCDLYMVSEGSVTRQQTLALPKDSPLRRNISRDIMLLQESGRLQTLEEKWFKSKCAETVFSTTEEQYEIPEFYPVTLGVFSSAFLMLVAGIILGGLVTIMEVCIYKWAENHKDDEGEAAEPMNKAYRDPDLESSDKMINSDTKRGGATQV